jgi:hypothetical protein
MTRNTLWIGWRLLTGKGAGLKQAGLIAVGVAIASSFLFAMASIPGAVADRQARDGDREWLSAGETTDAVDGALIAVGHDRFGSRAMTHILIAESDSEAIGLAPGQGIGTVLISPALAAELESDPSLAGRLSGGVDGILPEAFLLEPSELVSVAVVDPTELLATGEARALPGAPPSDPDVEISPDVLFVVSVALLVLALPVALFISAATRFGLERRRQRIRVLSLAGAERGQIRLFILLEVMSSALVGLVAGFAIFYLTRPLLAGLQVGGRGSFQAALWPPLPLGLAVVGFVLAASVLASLAGSRGVGSEPTMASTGRAMSAPGLVILGLGFAGLAVGLMSPSETDAPHPLALIGMVFTAVGLALTARISTGAIGRWLAARTGNGPTLLAARRMDRSPDDVNRPLVVVVTGVFVVSAFFTITGTLLRSSNFRYDDLAENVVVVEAPHDVLVSIVEEVESQPGVAGVAVEGLVAVESPDWSSAKLGVVASCEALTGVVDIGVDDCGSGVVIAAGDSVSPGTALVVGSAPPLSEPSAIREVLFSGSTFQGGFPASVIIDPAMVDDGFLSAVSEARALIGFDPAVGDLEGLRTAVVSAAPTAEVRAVAEIEFDQSSPAREVRRLALVGLALVFVIAAFSLTVGTASRLLEQRNAFAFLRAGGLLPAQIRNLVALESTAPLAVSAAVGGLLGVGVGAAVALSANTDPSVPWGQIGIIYMGSLALGVAVWIGFIPTLDRLTSPTGLRFE